MKLNNQEVRFDIADPRDARKYEETLIWLQEREKDMMNQRTVYTLDETMKEIIHICREAIRIATGKDVLRGCHNARAAKAVLQQFLREVAKQNDELYSPFDLGRIR